MKFTGVLLNLDGLYDLSGECFPPEAEIILRKDVLVRSGFERDDDLKNIVGKGTMERKGNQIMYDIELDPARVNERVARMLRPCAGGVVIERSGTSITKAEIKMIGLSLENTDPRIKKLGEE